MSRTFRKRKSNIDDKLDYVGRLNGFRIVNSVLEERTKWFPIYHEVYPIKLRSYTIDEYRNYKETRYHSDNYKNYWLDVPKEFRQVHVRRARRVMKHDLFVQLLKGELDVCIPVPRRDIVYRWN